jgi:CubicO group peptidase (beta-lactamase class C family)
MGHSFAEVAHLLMQGIEVESFPGAVLVVGYGGHVVYEAAVGHAALFPSPRRMTADTVFDLASLTKPIVTATALMLLIETGRVGLDEPVDSYIDTWCQPAADTPTLRQLLSHCAGLPAWRPFYQRVDYTFATPGQRPSVYAMVHRETPTSRPGTRTQYSDAGFIILGEVAETVTGMPLDTFCQQRICAPLQLGEMAFHPLGRARPADMAFASTEHCPWRRRILEGEVHDENAWIMGGVAGHAGLFATGRAVWRFGQSLLHGLRGHPWLVSTPTLRTFTTRQRAPAGTTWALGWDTPTPGKSSAGQYISPAAIGHLGFTGTSLWIDPEKDVIIVFLTNRVHPSRQRQGISTFRPRIHEAVMRALDVI